MIDSHTHLDNVAFGGDLDTVLAHAFEDGVGAFANIGFDPASASNTERFVSGYPFFYGVVGCHPHNADALDDKFEAEIRRLVALPRVVAVGEIGLDFYYDFHPPAVQEATFRRMIRLAREVDRPIVIHCRDAFDEVTQILADEGDTHRGIFHAFSGSAEMTARVLDLGFHIGIGGVSTFKGARLAETLTGIPVDRIVLETDCPYMTPHPLRGRRNEPAYVRFSAAAVARVKGMSLAEVSRLTGDNYRRLMRIEPEDVPCPVYKMGKSVYIHLIPDAADAMYERGLDDVVADPSASAEPAREAIICGAGDPLAEPGRVAELARMARRVAPNVRVITDGHYAGASGGVLDALQGSVDAISARLFGCTALQHDKVTLTGEETFNRIEKLLRAASASGFEAECRFTAVPKMKLEPCIELAARWDAEHSFRTYTSLEDRAA